MSPMLDDKHNAGFVKEIWQEGPRGGGGREKGRRNEGLKGWGMGRYMRD